ncbi:hypothetical protein HK405_013197 [Cladochytrium tenue]|nr:hypothetical protein HK405_013197 [Cladochytrium tenue]
MRVSGLVGPDPATVKQLAILATFTTMRMVVKRWKCLQGQSATPPRLPGATAASASLPSEAGSPFLDPLKTPKSPPRAAAALGHSAASQAASAAYTRHDGGPPTASTIAPLSSGDLTTQAGRLQPQARIPQRVRASGLHPGSRARDEVFHPYRRPAPSIMQGVAPTLADSPQAHRPPPSCSGKSFTSTSTPSLRSESTAVSTTSSICTPEEKAFLNCYSQRHAGSLHTLTTSALTLLNLPSHSVILGLLFVKRLLALPEIPPSLSTPTKLLLAGLVLADAQLCDSTVSMRTWAAVTGARGGGAQVAEIKRAALEALSFGTTVDADTYSRWMLSVKSLFRNRGGSGDDSDGEDHRPLPMPLSPLARAPPAAGFAVPSAAGQLPPYAMQPPTPHLLATAAPSSHLDHRWAVPGPPQFSLPAPPLIPPKLAVGVGTGVASGVYSSVMSVPGTATSVPALYQPAAL